MDAAVLYASVYGSSERYAREFSVRTGFPLRKISDAGNLVPFDTVFVFAPMYSGRLLFLKQILSMVPKRQQLVIVTVGLSDVRDPESTDWIMKCLSKRIPSKRMDRIDFFHLRGAIDYENLSFIHKLRTVLLYSRVKGLPIEEQNPVTRAFLGTYGKHIDFAEFGMLDKIVEYAGK